MDSFEKMRRKKLVSIIVVYGFVILLGMFCVMAVKDRIEKKRYYVPETEENAEAGIPSGVKLEELRPKENIRIGIQNPVYAEEDKLYVYLANYKESEVAISAFLYDEDMIMHADSGMIWQEQYLPYMILDGELSGGKEYYLNIAFYNVNDMTSEGSIWVKVGEIGNKK